MFLFQSDGLNDRGTCPSVSNMSIVHKSRVDKSIIAVDGTDDDSWLHRNDDYCRKPVKGFTSHDGDQRGKAEGAHMSTEKAPIY